MEDTKDRTDYDTEVHVRGLSLVVTGEESDTEVV